MSSILRVHLYKGKFIVTFNSDESPEDTADWFAREVNDAGSTGKAGFLIGEGDNINAIYPKHISYWEVESVSDNL
jgi:hypothetical protein